MKEIQPITLQRMNNGAHFLFATHLTSRAEADTKVKAKTESLIAAMRAALDQEDEALKLSQKSLITDDIAAADALRDSLYSGYKKAVNGYLSFPVEEQAKAARILWQHLKDYGIDTKMQLDKETGLLINLITDLEGKFAPQVTTLALTPFVTNLKAANEQVRRLGLDRTDERTGRTVRALQTARKAFDAAYREFVKMVNALALVEGEASYAAFIDYANTEIAHYKREVLSQRTHTPQPAPGEGGDTPGAGETPGEGGDTPGGGETPGGGGSDPGNGGDPDNDLII